MATTSDVAARALHREFAADLELVAGHKPWVLRVHGSPDPIKSYRLTAGQMRDVFLRRIRAVRALTLARRLSLAGLLLKSRTEEQGHMALGVLHMSADQLTAKHFPKLDKLIDEFTTWWMVDDFATGKGSVTADLLASFPKETLRLHKKWVTSPNLWKRRMSVVTFTRKTASDGRYVDETLHFCEALMRDPEDLVQKAVGWALKDTIRAGPGAKRRVLALVKRMRREGIPSTITLYAIRDLKGAEREAVLSIKPSRREKR